MQQLRLFLAPMLLLVLFACSSHRTPQSIAPQHAPTPVAADILTDDSRLAEALEKMAARLDAARDDLHVPGMALAVVKDDEIVFARGFGLADMEHNVPVHPGSVFGIGSASKAFTATLAGMLVEEETLSWDDHVEKHLPYLTLKVDSDNPEDKVTLRDMLSHRTGFTRMGMISSNPNRTREAMLRDAAKAKPWDGFRENFHYTNIMYVGAGEATGKAAGTTWEDLLQQRIFDPLGMSTSSSDINDSKIQDVLATPYQWDEGANDYQRIPPLKMISFGPAGSINSSVLDMAQWLRFQMGKGTYAGKTLLGADILSETHRPQMAMNGEMDYGLGWMLQGEGADRVVMHGGSVLGYSSIVAFMPEKKVGIVVLANTTSSPIHNQAVGAMIKLASMDDAQAPAQVAEQETETGDQTPDLSPYLGDYQANFGPFKDAWFTIGEQDGHLAVTVPGQGTMALHPENEEGKWVFQIQAGIALSFEKNPTGKVTLMRLHQSGFDFELPRKGVPIQPEIDEAELVKFTGTYRSEQKNTDVQVVIHNHRLAIAAGPNMKFELHLPDENGHRRVRVKQRNSMVFNTNDQGEVVSFSRFISGEFKEELKRVEGEKVPSMAEIHTLRQSDKRKAVVESLGGYRLKGKVLFLNAGLEGKLDYTSKGHQQYLMAMDLGEVGQLVTGVTSDYGAVRHSYAPFQTLEGIYLEQAHKSNMAAVFFDWRLYYDTEEVLGFGTYNDRKTILIRLSGGETPATTLHLDAETGDILMQRAVLLAKGIGRLNSKLEYADYRELNGVRIPYKTTLRNPFFGEVVYQFEETETGLQFPDQHFQVTEAD